MPRNASRPSEQVDALRVALRARAAGWWRLAGDSLEQVAFAASPEMPAEVALGFTEATRSVPLSSTQLGIVRAQATGEVAVSRLEDSDPDQGSGLWLRRFGASRSVAVPTGGRVVSVALADSELTDAEVADQVRRASHTWGEPS